MKERFPAIILLATSIALSLPFASIAAGDECVPQGCADLAIGGATGRTFYVDGDLGAPDFEMTGIVLYEEFNGIADMQRLDARHDATCGGLIESDTLILFV